MRWQSSSLAAVLVALAACGTSDDSIVPGADATTDVATGGDSGTDAASDVAPPPPGDGGSQVIIGAAGDISDNAIGDQKKTSDLLLSGYDGVLLLGDNQYPDGTPADYTNFFAPTWGRVKSITHPAPGNHDYHTAGAAGYYGYFGAAAGDPAKGYYSYDMGAWHLIALNTNDNDCGFVACNGASAQVTWLKADLAKNKTKCTLAYWHHPRFNSGSSHGDFAGAQAIWDALYAADADVILNGHEHVYERFDPQNPAGVADAVRGMRQFTVGTGGAGFYAFGTPKANSAVREDASFGILKLTLKATSYDWEFVAVAPSKFTDKGTGNCH